MTTEITLGGYSLETLKTMKAAIQKDATAFIADQIDIAENAVRQIVLLREDKEEADVDDLARQAVEALDAAKLVSGISDVEYFLSYNEEYATDDDAMSTQLREVDIEEYGGNYSEDIEELLSRVSEMEYQSYLWNSSSIGC